jgi:hypothetical protein
MILVPVLVLAAICISSEQFMLHSVRGRLFFTGRYDTAVSATGFNVVLLRIIGCAWLRAGELAVCGKDGCAKGCMPMENPQ